MSPLSTELPRLTCRACASLAGQRLNASHSIAIDDPENRQVKIHQAFSPTAAGAASGALWGTFVGLLFLNPLLGAAVGAGAGALSGMLVDVGIKEIGQTLRPYHPKVIRTSLSYANEAELVRALAGRLEGSPTRTASATGASST